MTGALLAKEGHRVIVFEKNRTLGGGLQSFRRGSFTFDTGMHLFGGMEPSGPLWRLFRHLGILDKVHVEPRTDIIVANGTSTPLPTGKEAWKDAMLGLATEPSSRLRGSLDRYVAQIEELYNDHLQLSPSSSFHTPTHYPLPATHYLDLLYGGRPDSPALLHALVAYPHIHGGVCSLSGSTYTLAEALAGIIEAAGGEIHCGEEVTAIEAAGHRVSAITTRTAGYQMPDAAYVSAMPIGRLLAIAPDGAFSKSTRARIATAPYTDSAFCLFIGLKPGTLPYRNQAWYLQDSGTGFPHSSLILPSRNSAGEDGQSATTLKMVCPMPFGTVRQWEDSTTGHRPDDYYRWKETIASQALGLLDRLPFTVPPRDAVAYLETASPLTIRDYYGTPHGAMFGIHRTCSNFMQTSFSTRTRLDNLFLTGQDINFHGMMGTSITAILTAETIVGKGAIISKINHLDNIQAKPVS